MANVELAPVRAIETSSLPTTSENLGLNYGLATFLYLAASTLTRPVFIADTMYYLRTANPELPVFWDFGHLLWRSLVGIVLHNVAGPNPSDRLLHAFRVLDFLSAIAGLFALWLTLATLRLFTHRILTTVVSALLLSFSQVVLICSKGGNSYIFGFLALSGGFYILIAAAKAHQTRWGTAAISGASLALAVCLWLPYIFAVPGALLAPFLFSDRPRKERPLVLGATAICALVGLGAYGTVAIHLGIRDARGFFAWAEASSHGAIISGATRVFFGFARSFVSIGDSVLFKRFLLRDPYNTVRVWQVLGQTSWKIMLFYVFLASVLGSLARSTQGRRALLQLAIMGLPVLGFAVAWQGSDVERYLPLFPALMLALGLGLINVRIPSPTAWVVAAFVTTLIIGNVAALSTGTRKQRLQEQTGTVRTLNELLPPGTLVLVPPMHPLNRIYWDFPEALPLAEHRLQLEWFLALGAADTPQWRTRLCSLMSQHWNQRIPVVIDSSLMGEAPRRNSYWAEGDDRRVRWSDINNFTSQFELGNRVGNTDFFWIPATTRNIQTVDGCRN
jgi:hypothetical protein